MRDWLKQRNWVWVIWIGIVGLLCLNVYIADRLYIGQTAAGQLEITVLNVGQGDSILIRSPDGQYGLIDGGRGKVVLEELAKHMPIWERNFDFVVGTHPDADHIEGLVHVLERYSVDTVFWEQTAKTNNLIQRLTGMVQERQIPAFQLHSENDFRLGCCVEFDVIWPWPEIDTYAEDESNEVSLTLVIRYKYFQMFLGGDLYVNQEEKAIEKLAPELRKVDVLKVSHHGSKTSTSAKFLNLIDAQIGLISAGKGNSYGHPAASVLSSLEEAGVEVFRTDTEGAIRLQTDGEILQIKTSARLENLALKD